MRQLLAFAEFVRKQYQGIIIGAVLWDWRWGCGLPLQARRSKRTRKR